MKIIRFPFRITQPALCIAGPNVPHRSADIDEITEFLKRVPLAVVLFVTYQKYCVVYERENSWIKDWAVTFEIDDDVDIHFNVAYVPQWRWYCLGKEVHRLTGAATAGQFYAHNMSVVSKLNRRQRK